MPAPQTASDILQKARELISKPEAWTKGSFARDAEGRTVRDINDDRATCWCLLGAVSKSTRDLSMGNQEYRDARFCLRCAVGARCGLGDADSPLTTASFNDDPHTTHADILAVFDDAIVRAISLENAR